MEIVQALLSNAFDITGRYIELWGFDNMADLEKCKIRLSKDEKWMELVQEIALLIDPATFSMNIWKYVM